MTNIRHTKKNTKMQKEKAQNSKQLTQREDEVAKLFLSTKLAKEAPHAISRKNPTLPIASLSDPETWTPGT
eukprot:SAG11_NODE_2970_length_2802_cov_6.706252_3_plen_71_part_00